MPKIDSQALVVAERPLTLKLDWWFSKLRDIRNSLEAILWTFFDDMQMTCIAEEVMQMVFVRLCSSQAAQKAMLFMSLQKVSMGRFK